MNKQALYTLFIAGLASLLLAACLTGCTAETAGASGIPVPVTITLTSEKVAATTSLDIYIVNAESKIEKHVDETDFSFSIDGNDAKGTTQSPVELLPGTKTVYAFANCTGSGFSGLGLADGSANWTSVPEAVSGNDAFNVHPETISDNAIPMSAFTTWEVKEASEKAETPYTIELVRMVAKMEIKIEDKRANQSNKITSLTLGKFQPNQTNLFRRAPGEVELPAASSLSDRKWEWQPTADDANPPVIAPFYLHETTGSFTVSMVVANETPPRTATLNVTIPRNRIYPLTICLTDYSLDISGTYHLAAIGTVSVSKNIGNGYTIELPEGSSDVTINIQLKEGSTVKNSGVTWSCEPLPPYFTSNPSGADATLILSSAAIPAITSEQTVTVKATLNGQSQPRSFTLTFKAVSLTDDLTKATPASPLRKTQPISIEL